MKSLRLALVMLLLLGGVGGAWAQTAGILYTYVVNNQGGPVANAQVTVIADTASGASAFYHQQPTGANGLAITTVPITNNMVWVYNVYVQACGATYSYSVNTMLTPNGQTTWVDTVVTGCGGTGGGNCVLTFSSQQFSGMDVWFNATLSPAPAPGTGVTYVWSFGDGTSATTSGASYAHTYAQPGAYTVCCTATVANGGCQVAYCQSVVVNQPSCLASFTYTMQGNTVCLTNTSISANTPTNLTWYIGNTNYFGLDSLCHTFSSPGTYSVILYIQDSLAQCWDSASVSITVGGSGGGGCQAYFTAVNQNGAYVLTGQNVGGNPNSTSYTWALANGTTLTGNPITITPNMYGLVCLTVSNAQTGCSDTYCDTVGLPGSGGNCNLTFTYNQNGSLVQFVPTLSGATPNTGTLVWNFGDGTSSTSYMPTHTYTSPGTYTVCCTLTTASGCVSAYCTTVTVQSVNTGCNLVASFTYFVQGNTVCFQNTSTGSYQNISWNIMGNGAVQTFNNQTNLCVTLGSNAAYTVFLSIWDTSSNCFDSASVVFTLGNPANNPICVSGQVLAANNNVAQVGVAYLVTLDAATGMLYAVDTAYILPADSGYYSFCNVQPGFYTVKAHLTPNDPSYAFSLPTYLGNELMWYDAAVINLSSTTVVNDITLILGTNPGGPGFISGLVSQGANKTAVSLEGATVIAMDELNSQAVVAYALTDAAGVFGFPSLPYGTYRLRTDMLNLYAQDQLVVLGPMNPSADNVEIEMGPNQPTTAPEAAVVQGTPTLFPNPAQADARIRFSLVASATVAIRVVDATGRTVHTATEALPAGSHELGLPSGSFGAGLYYVTLTTGSQSFTARLVRH